MLADRRTLGRLADRDYFRDRDGRAWFAVAVRQPDSDVGGQRLTGHFVCRHRDRISSRNWHCSE
jgi:hypothetical protein